MDKKTCVISWKQRVISLLHILKHIVDSKKKLWSIFAPRTVDQVTEEIQLDFFLKRSLFSYKLVVEKFDT